MRQLSQQLVATQEEERKKLSRELHDHVGQMLTALRMELGRIDRLRGLPADRPRRSRGRRRMPAARGQHGPHRPRSRARPPAEHARRLRAAAGARMARARLQPPLRRAGRADGRRRLRSPDRAAPHVRLPGGAGGADQLRQARARAADRGHRRPTRPTGSSVSITDDGVGIDPRSAQEGSGLRGIEERVRELRGTMRSTAPPDAGTTLTIQLPLPPRPTEVLRARAAG